MAKTTILDLLFAKNAPSAFHRPLVVISIIICGIWSAFFVSEVGNFVYLDPSEWLTYFIGLIVAAFAAPTVLGIYFFLPPLGENRQWEKGLLAVSAVVVAGWFLSIINNLGMFSMDELPAAIVIFLFCTLAPTFAIKALMWMWQGVRGRESDR